MLEVDLVEELGLGVGEVVGADAGAGVHLLGQHLQVLVQQFPLHHPVKIKDRVAGHGYRRSDPAVVVKKLKV